MENEIKAYIENIGDCNLYVTVMGKDYIINPGKRKEIKPENADPERL